MDASGPIDGTAMLDGATRGGILCTFKLTREALPSFFASLDSLVAHASGK
jgi:hypothetical protein